MSVSYNDAQKRLDKAADTWKQARGDIPRFGKYIITYTGKVFRPLDPVADDLDIIDIAHALGNICRFTGHSRSFYSVAQHSVVVSRHVPEELALQGLLHDAAEAYLTDISSPVKSILDNYKTYESQLERIILRKYCGVSAYDPAIKVADRRALVTEARDLMPRPELFTEPDSKRVEPFKEVINPWNPTRARNLFLERFVELQGWDKMKYFEMVVRYYE